MGGGHSPRNDDINNLKDLDDNFDDRGMKSPLQSASQANQMVGMLSEKFEKMQAILDE